MAYEIPFHQDTYKPQTIKGNLTSDTPVEFDLSAAGGPDLARLKSLVYATSALSIQGSWSPEVQTAVISAFSTSSMVFVRTIDAIRNLTVPASLALKAGVIESLENGQTKKTQIPITTGAQFALIAGFVSALAFEIAMQIAKLSKEADVDPRFFDSFFTSLVQAIPKPGSGTAPSATTQPDAGGTAETQTPASRSEESTCRCTS